MFIYIVLNNYNLLIISHLVSYRYIKRLSYFTRLQAIYSLNLVCISGLTLIERDIDIDF